MGFSPFDNGTTRDHFRRLVNQIVNEIRSLEPDYVLRASRTELEEYYIARLLIEPLVLHPDKQCIADQEQIDFDVTNDPVLSMVHGRWTTAPGTRLKIEIPFEGDPQLWRLCPSQRCEDIYWPSVEIASNCVVLTVSFPNATGSSQAHKNSIAVTVKRISEMVGFLKTDIDGHNNSVPGIVKTAIQQKMEEARRVTDTIESLGIPMKKRDQPLTYTLPMKRRQNPVRLPEVSKEPYRLEPVLEEAQYGHILTVMRSMSLVIERNPRAFASLDEEDIRTHFLLQLNGHYEGGATGETFNVSGKTDVLIRVEDRNCFIAECKFWRGPKAFDKAIEQLLGYLSWRDVKCALVVFNKNKHSSAVRARMDEIMKNRVEYKKTVSHDPEGDSRYIYVKASDPGREIIITTQLYDIPCEDGGNGVR